MATTPTQLPVPSEKPQDLKFNAGKIDEFVTSLALQYIDRFGSAHYTIEGIKQLAFDAMSNFGYVTISSFEEGATLTNPNEALLWESNGEYYKWTGNFPKTVTAGSTPDNTGGIGPGTWLSIGDSLLRTMVLKLISYNTPEYFGATGDGSRDDAAELQLAFSESKPTLLTKNYKTANSPQSPVFFGSNKKVSMGGAPFIMQR